METEVSCACCWKSFSCTVPGLVPRLLDCGHSLCTDCLGMRLALITTSVCPKFLREPKCVHSGDVLTRPKFKVLKCPHCGEAHTLDVKADVSAVKLNYAVFESLQRLHQTGTFGGLLPSESVVLGQQPIVTSRHSAVYPAMLRMDNKQIQVCASFA